MADLSRLDEFRRELEKVRSQKDRARGVMDETLKRIRTEFGVRNIKAAVRKLKILKRVATDKETTYAKMMAELESRWKKQCRME